MAPPRKYQDGFNPLNYTSCEICGGKYMLAHKSRHYKSQKHRIIELERGKKNIQKMKQDLPQNKLMNEERELNEEPIVIEYEQNNQEEKNYEENNQEEKNYEEKCNIIAKFEHKNNFIEICENDDEYYFKIDDSNKKYGSVNSVIPIIPIPLTNGEREVGYIIGKSGSGKSTYCRDYIKKWQELHPDKSVYIIAKDEDDKALQGLGAYKITSSDFEDPTLTMDDFDNGSLILMDDIDSIRGADKILKNIYKLRDEILESGRKREISLLITSHEAYKGRMTKLLLTEMHTITLFPAGLPSIDYFLKTYLGFNTKQVREIRKLKGRYVTIHNGVPQWVLSKYRMYFIE